MAVRILEHPFLEIRLKKILLALSMVLAGASLSLTATEVDAKRLGGGKPAGAQHAAPAQATPHNAAPQQAANPAAAGNPAAAAPKRNWMGPLAGLAAGLGLAALASHFGFGEGLANFMMMALMAVAAFFVIRWLMGRFGGARRQTGGMQLAGAGAPFGAQTPQRVEPQDMQRQALQPLGSDVAPGTVAGSGAPAVAAGAAAAATANSAPAAVSLPAGMDAADFERVAKMIFIRLQAANDSGNVDDLRRFTTPELFASLKADLLERGNAKQQTDVLQLDARIAHTARENGQWIVSVRFSGLIREQADTGGEAFAEIWHLVKPLEGEGDWAIAGITPQAA